VRPSRPLLLVGSSLSVALIAGLVVYAMGGSGSPHPDATVEELHSAFSICTYPDADRGDPAEFLAQPVDWVNIVEIRSDPALLEVRTYTPAIEVSVRDDAGEVSRMEVSMYWEFWPGVQWALANGGTAWAAVGDPQRYEPKNYLIYVLAFTADGRMFMPGDCHDKHLFPVLQDRFGEEIDSRAAEMTRLTGTALRELLGVVTDAEGQVELPVILNPATVPEALLRSLQFALLAVTVSDVIGSESTICTKSSAGWNDCFVPDARAVAPGYLIDAYLADDGILEVWLLDAHANLLAPLELLGTVTVESDLRSVGEVALRIHFDRGRGSVEILEQLPIAHLDERVERWEALGD
jgi:hypothetical protein